MSSKYYFVDSDVKEILSTNYKRAINNKTECTEDYSIAILWNSIDT